MARYGSYKAQIRAIEQKMDISSQQREKLMGKIVDGFRATVSLEWGDDDAATKKAAAELPKTLELCKKYDVTPKLVNKLIENE